LLRLKTFATPPAVCPKCGSHRTRIIGQSAQPALVYARCDVCGHVFVPPSQKS
jgi:uncharacterized OB-fold protein